MKTWSPTAHVASKAHVENSYINQLQKLKVAGTKAYCKAIKERIEVCASFPMVDIALRPSTQNKGQGKCDDDEEEEGGKSRF